MSIERNEREVTDDDLMEDAKDPVQAARLHKSLRTLRDNPNVPAQLQQMAREVLSGRLSMTDVAKGGTYLDALGDSMMKIKRAAENMTPEEAERNREAAERYRREQEEAEAREQAERDAPSQPQPDTPRPRSRRGRI
jgi:ribulose kinase